MIRLTRLSLLLVFGFIFSCPLAAQDSTRLYVYSPWDCGQTSWLPISYDGVRIAKLQAGKFFAIHAPPGQHHFAAGQGVPINVEVRRGEDQFVRLDQAVTLTPSGESMSPALTLQSSDDARHAIAQLVYVAPSKIYSPVVDQKDPTLQWSPKLEQRPSHSQ